MRTPFFFGLVLLLSASILLGCVQEALPERGGIELPPPSAPQERSPDAGSTEGMVLIPAGNFIMGRESREGWSPMAAPEMFGDELPAHEVYVDAFYIDTHEVTNREFREFVDATRYITDAEDVGGSWAVVPAQEADTPFLGTDIGWKWVEGATWQAPEGPESGIENLLDHQWCTSAGMMRTPMRDG